MRQIIIDTETTGLEPEQGHRIIEIGCVELINRKLTGNTFHEYINPEREIDADALNIHGISGSFLQDKPLFVEIIDDFLNFINGAEIIAHNASFDVDFINHEIKLIGTNRQTLDSYVTVFDTLALARKKFPGQRNTLDAICRRYQIDLADRKQHGHGALLDAELLAQAYLFMTGGQGTLFNEMDLAKEESASESANKITQKINKAATIVTKATDCELAEHNKLLANIKEKSGKCLWDKIK